MVYTFHLPNAIKKGNYGEKSSSGKNGLGRKKKSFRGTSFIQCQKYHKNEQCQKKVQQVQPTRAALVQSGIPRRGGQKRKIDQIAKRLASAKVSSLHRTLHGSQKAKKSKSSENYFGGGWTIKGKSNKKKPTTRKKESTDAEKTYRESFSKG